MEALAQETVFAPDLEGAGASGEPEWLRSLRSSAAERFDELGFPTPKLEEWRYTGIGPITAVPWASARDEGTAGIRISAPRAGARVSRLQELLVRDPATIEPYLGRIADSRDRAFPALNTALFRDGVVVEIEAGAVLSEPVRIAFEPPPEPEPAVWYPRVLVLARRSSQGTVVESYGGAGQAFTDAVTEVFLEDGAVVEHYKLQRENAAASHVHAIDVLQQRASRFVSHNVAFGGLLARTELGVRLDGEGSECELNGLFVGNGRQHLDNHTLIDHAKPHCSSRELYKGILDGSARGVFHGTIIVRPDAQKTDAIQTNKNLLLSRSALVNSTPALEIFADDVKCKHGSTIGQLDPAALFYLRSRGISEEEARALLTYAFAADVSARMKLESIRSEVESAVGRRLEGAGAETEGARS
jgi:Fe-S cluster assembly protein SufD